MVSDEREIIVERYMKNVHGKKPDTDKYTTAHDGKEGHWLEKQMGIPHNRKTEPDLLGYEMKNDTTSKTTFGDWSADYYIFNDTKYNISRDEFMKIFGHPNPKKEGRLSWSGSPIPKIDQVNSFGQELVIDQTKNIVIRYSYSKDSRENKSSLVPDNLQIDNLTVARWDTESLKEKVENKFNQKGWFKCLKNKDGRYESIVFGNPMNFETFMESVSKGDIFFDSGMYQGNLRNYSQWRANNTFWDNLVVDRHP